MYSSLKLELSILVISFILTGIGTFCLDRYPRDRLSFIITVMSGWVFILTGVIFILSLIWSW